MNKNLGVIIGIVVVIAILGMIYSSSGNKGVMNDETKDKAMMGSKDQSAIDKDMIEDKSMAKETNKEMNKTDSMMKVGTYEAYAPEKILKASSDNHVVLFFRASWCPSCQAIDKDIRANLTKIPNDLTILDVNYDNSNDLKKKYGVTYQHTFVQVDKEGNMIKKWSGSPTLSVLVSEVK